MTGRVMAAERFNEIVPGSTDRSARILPRPRVTLMSAQGLRQFVPEDAADRSWQRQLDAVAWHEDRIRKNLAAVASNDALHARLTRELDADETRIEQLAALLADARAAADKAHQALAEAAADLRI